MQRPHVPKTEQPATRDQGTRIDRQMQAQKSSVRGNSLTGRGGGGFKEEEEDGDCRLPEEMEKRPARSQGQVGGGPYTEKEYREAMATAT